MSWLISLIMASVVFTADSTVPVHKDYKYTNSETTKVIRLDETERFEQTYPLSPNGRVSVSNLNGSITINTWDRSEVRLQAVKTADTRERLSEVEIRIDARQEWLRVETEYNQSLRTNGRNWKNTGNLTVDYHLTVPRDAVLNEIETVNGSVVVADSRNFTKASAVNGQVRATNLRGTANLSTVNGNVEANFDQLKSGDRISLNTVNGQVILLIPSDANATVKADTVNGDISNNFGLPVRKGQYVGRDLYGRIGSGETQIRLSSVNGGLNIKRRDDGRSPNPATNLLPTTAGSDDGNSDAPVNTVELNREIARAQKEATRELRKIQPEIKRITEESVKLSTEVLKTTPVLDPAVLEEKIKEAQARQQKELSGMSEIYLFASAPVVESKGDSFAVKGTPRVSIDARGCAVTVRGWDKPEVRYSVTRVYKNRSVKPIALSAENKDSAVTIKVANPDGGQSGGFTNDFNQIRLEVFVPKKSNLRILTDGEVRLQNVSGEIDLEGEDESISIRDVDGRLRVASHDGRIRVIGFRGEIESKTIDGEISLEGDFQKISAQTVDGIIILTLPDTANASILSNKKDIRVEGLSLVPAGEEKTNSVFRIGKGGERFRLFAAEDGQVFIRSANSLRASY